MDCVHKVSASSDSSLNEDAKGLAPKHREYSKKLPEIHRWMSQSEYFILEKLLLFFVQSQNVCILDVSLWI